VTRIRVCARPGCPHLTATRYCAAHTTLATTTSRGLGADHQRRRAQLIPAAISTRCPLCGELMQPGEPLDLDHSTPRALDSSSVGDRIVHASCNRAAGAKLGHELRRRG
jgi:hypothetical protein